ncbi:16241_t:CDS:1 [Funneliformis caledonium]|uniref:16241_t:CDS:1 n=1 Tax=Funneliformis caledonium TaxID=1117310 RepID=A0A9N9GNL0_9GLOM|nr:16241_t:CDS:1 [Funneliformis caledonium]
MFMKQIPSLKELKCDSTENLSNASFIHFPGSLECLKNLSVLKCSSGVYPEFFYQLSQSCHNIQSLTIKVKCEISNGLIDLISLQNNLKHLTLIIIQTSFDNQWTEIIPSLTNHSKTLIKLRIYGGENYGPLSFIADFKNLQELFLSFYYLDTFGDFKELQHVDFPHLRILKFPYGYPNHEYLIKFLERNGKNLIEFDIGDDNVYSNLAIAKFCPNLRILSTLIDDLSTLEEILINCQQLESLKVWCGNGNDFFNESELLELIAKCSPKMFYELKIYYAENVQSELLSKELESFLSSWTNRTPLSLIIINNNRYCSNSLDTKNENLRIIEKYHKLGIIKKFKILIDDDE